jgi:nucleoside-diphosphate kinase
MEIMVERTFAMIKPDALESKHTGKIIDRIEKEGFRVIALQRCNLNKAQAELFYEVHNARPFFGELVNFMISGPVVMMVLEKENAIAAWRDLMGSTNPKDAAEGTLRKVFGTSIGNNAVHGSDSKENAKREITLFFPLLA